MLCVGVLENATQNRNLNMKKIFKLDKYVYTQILVYNLIFWGNKIKLH